MDRRLEIHPCFLQDIGPLGPQPKKLDDVDTEDLGKNLSLKSLPSQNEMELVEYFMHFAFT